MTHHPRPVCTKGASRSSRTGHWDHESVFEIDGINSLENGTSNGAPWNEVRARITPEIGTLKRSRETTISRIDVLPD
jgi:hypothetical protein